MWELLLWLVPLASVDSLNPATIALQVLILSLPNPGARSTAYLAGIYITYFLGGWVLYSALTPIREAMAMLPESFKLLSMAGIGVLLIAVGIYFGIRAKGRSTRSEQPNPEIKSGVQGAFWLGAVVTATDMPTAVPYIAAVDRLVLSEHTWPDVAFALAVYCLVYIGPMLFLVGIFMCSGLGSREKLERVQRAVARWSEPVLALLCLASGTALVGWSLVKLT